MGVPPTRDGVTSETQRHRGEKPQKTQDRLGTSSERHRKCYSNSHKMIATWTCKIKHPFSKRCQPHSNILRQERIAQLYKDPTSIQESYNCAGILRFPNGFNANYYTIPIPLIHPTAQPYAPIARLCARAYSCGDRIRMSHRLRTQLPQPVGFEMHTEGKCDGLLIIKYSKLYFQLLQAGI